MMRLIFVLGMHRSGTSCLTGLLENVGVHLGDVMKSNLHNLKGNQENRAVIQINNSVLETNGGSWHNPPKGQLPWSKEQLVSASDFLRSEMRSGVTMALKDPRCVFTMDGWVRAAREIGAEVCKIGTFRRPEKVVASLRARNSRFDEAQCLEIWKLYNCRLIERQEQDSFPLVDFDLTKDAYLANVERAFDALSLPTLAGELFFTDGLRRQDERAVCLPELESIHERLVQLRC